MPTDTTVDWNLTSDTSRADSIVNNPIWAMALKIVWWILVIFVLFIISKIIAALIRKSILKNSSDENMEWTIKIANLLWDVAFYVMLLISFFIGFEVMWFNIGLLVSWVSFWLWLAFKELLWNMFAGIMILYTKEFKIGDIIEIQTDQLYFGRIEEITIRYTVVRTLDLRQVVFPNITLISVPVKTFSSEELVRLDTTIWVHYNTDLNIAIKTMVDSINSFDFVDSKENTKVFVQAFGDSAINLKAIFYYDPKRGLIEDVVLWYIHEKINDEFTEKWIVIPYNQVTLNFESKKDREKIKEKLADVEATGDGNL